MILNSALLELGKFVKSDIQLVRHSRSTRVGVANTRGHNIKSPDGTKRVLLVWVMEMLACQDVGYALIVCLLYDSLHGFSSNRVVLSSGCASFVCSIYYSLW